MQASNERGFTVIELLVVFAIFSMLIGLTVVAVSEMRVRAMTTSADQELEIVQKALWTYMLTENVERLTPNPCVGDFSSSNPPLYPQYLNRPSPASGRAYAWDAEGNVTYCERHATSPVGSYYGTEDLSGPVLLSRVEDSIDFNWGWGRPHPALPADHFSVRWEFALQAAEEGLYRFRAHTSDGVRIWVNGELIINEWRGKSPSNVFGVIFLTPGVYPVKVEYYEGTGLAVARVTWEYLGK